MSTAPAPGKGNRQTYSTSEARANFAKALGTANEKNTVIGFDRYGKLVAAVVSIDAVRILAGRADEVDAAVRGKIERMSRIVLAVAPQVGTPLVGSREIRGKGIGDRESRGKEIASKETASTEEPTVKKRKSEQKHKRRDKRRNKQRKRKAKSAASKRHRKISRKI